MALPAIKDVSPTADNRPGTVVATIDPVPPVVAVPLIDPVDPKIRRRAIHGLLRLELKRMIDQMSDDELVGVCTGLLSPGHALLRELSNFI